MILLENVTKEYDLPTGKAGQLVAADRVTLEVPAGEVFGLVGPNGAGKTTKLKMICGLMLPKAGRITVNNIDVEREPEELPAGSFRMVFAAGDLGSRAGGAVGLDRLVYRAAEADDR